MSLEIPTSLFSGETAIVHVSLPHAAALDHVAQKWPSLSVHRVALAGEHPHTNDFADHRRVPAGHVAIQIEWRQQSPRDPIGVPITFHQEAQEALMKNRFWWYIVAFWMSRRSPIAPSSSPAPDTAIDT